MNEKEKIPHIITVSGPSLSGKTELTKILQEKYQFNSVISVTTRPKRSHEVHGADYYFLTHEEYSLKRLVQKTHFNEHHYGVTEDEILSKKNAPILWVVAPGSIDQIEQYCKDHHYQLTKIFVTNPEEVLYERLFSRFRADSSASIDTYVKRLQSMQNVEKQWVIEAKNNPDKYDILITKFNNENTQEVINKVLSHIEKKEINNIQENNNYQTVRNDRQKKIR